MGRNPFASAPQEMREVAVSRTRGREINLSGPVDEGSGGQVGTVTADGRVVLYGLLDITQFEGFNLA